MTVADGGCLNARRSSEEESNVSTGKLRPGPEVVAVVGLLFLFFFLFLCLFLWKVVEESDGVRYKIESFIETLKSSSGAGGR